MGSKTLLVVCCLLAAQAYAQYQQDDLESGRLQPRPQPRIRLPPQGGAGPSGEFVRQGIPTAPRRRPIPAGAFPVPVQGPNSRGRLQLPSQHAPQPAPIPQAYPSTLKPAPVREELPVQNAIPQPTFASAAPVEENLDEDDEEIATPRTYSSPATSAQYVPVQLPRTTAQPPPLPYRVQQTARQSRPPPVFRPEPRNSPIPQEIPVRQNRPQPRPQVAPLDQRGERGERERAPVPQSVRRYREDRPDGSIVWGFENDDGSFKEEVIGADCIVRGKYGYIDPEGVRREYDYTSGNPCERDEQGRLIPDDDAGEGGQYVLPQGANELNLNVKHKSRRPIQ